MHDLARYLGALHRIDESVITSIEYNGFDYTWDDSQNLSGSNWAKDDITLVSVITAVFENSTEPMTSILSSTSHDLIDNALDYIHKNYTKRISLYSLAEELKMSSSHVSRTFKKMTSFNMNEYINRYRVNQSMSLLVEGKYKLYEIASMCGFKEYKYYYHVFTQYVQMSPKEFIKTAYLIDKKNNTTL